ncbi:hypothetical protein SASPL_145321 [Salvia splendens]|uniref:ADF-H domain-containing protein n=1 Tax=Salvia splendens TaxID=180675 RepID=A0A8X8WHE5_SALSN|nr:hypothetical protein SASPL_145321 [Salvia splendens]
MLYATSKDGLRRALEGIHYEVQATDPTEMGFDHTHHSLVFSNEFRYDSEDGNSGELRWGNIHVVAVKSQMIRHIIEDGCAGTSIPLPNVTAKILSKVIEAFHAEFVKENQGILLDLIMLMRSTLATGLTIQLPNSRRCRYCDQRRHLADFSFSMSDLRRRNVDLTLFIGSGKDAVFRGCELPRHQDPSRAHVPNCSGYDQGKNS